MKVLRTPDDRFTNLPGYPFKPHYIDDLAGYEGIRVHYVQEGPLESADVYLCLHGQPTWSYLYRKMIPVFTAAGGRVVAPDLIGFGKSDKPVDDSVYTFDFHRNMLLRLIERLDLKNITLVVQDWGGLLGLTLPMEMPERFSRLLVMNTGLAGGDQPLTPGFYMWREYCRQTPDMAVGKLIGRGTPMLSKEERAAYDAPFPDVSYKAGVRTFPNLVPDSFDAPGAELSRRAREWWANSWKGKTFMAIGMLDPVLGKDAMMDLHKYIRGCPEPLEHPEAGHFVQEWGDEIAAKALAAWAK